MLPSKWFSVQSLSLGVQKQMHDTLLPPLCECQPACTHAWAWSTLCGGPLARAGEAGQGALGRESRRVSSPASTTQKKGARSLGRPSHSHTFPQKTWENGSKPKGARGYFHCLSLSRKTASFLIFNHRCNTHQL